MINAHYSLFFEESIENLNFILFLHFCFCTHTCRISRISGKDNSASSGKVSLFRRVLREPLDMNSITKSGALAHILKSACILLLLIWHTANTCILLLLIRQERRSGTHSQVSILAYPLREKKIIYIHMRTYINICV
jgi:hypothetical protein